jgi:DNA primase|tara:strand:- start:1839 stop:2708 length:870 start_codon:yes stop_codon:yes gene_type:complete
MTTEVEKLLTDKDVTFHSKGKDLLIKCFNPEHEDENPSMRVDREDGMYHCLGCGYKGNVFTRFNRYRNIFNSRVNGVKELITELRKASWAGFDIPTDAFFINEMFRGIPAHIMTKFDAHTTNNMGMEDRMVFPISDNRGVIIGFQGRFIHTDAKPKYLMYPAGVSLPWYPAVNKLEMINASIILTEGLLDALYLHGKGMTNAVTIFGTKSVTFDTILDLLTPFMLAGLQKVYLLMDGDSAGRNAAEHIEKMIKHKTDLIVESIPLEEGEDPATMSDHEINKLKKYLQNS